MLYSPAVALPAPKPQRLPLRFSLQTQALGWERILHIGLAASPTRYGTHGQGEGWAHNEGLTP